MARQIELENAVLEAIYRLEFERSPILKSTMSKRGKVVGIGILKIQSKITFVEDTPYKIRIDSGAFVGYGYDLTQSDGKGVAVREIYEKELESARSSGRMENNEFLVEEGKLEGRIAWFITEPLGRYASY